MEQLQSGPKESLMMSGPNFEGNEQKSWFKRNGSNIILTLIGILIIAGGIYLYSNYQKNAAIITGLDENSQNQSGIITTEQINLSGRTNTQNNSPSALPIAEIVKSQDSQITVRAKRGAGITHLAREATKNYLEKNQGLKQKITPEQKIYIEDYITKKTGHYGLKIDQEINFNESLIKEAVDKSETLNQNQLKNLHKYVLLVPSLSG